MKISIFLLCTLTLSVTSKSVVSSKKSKERKLYENLTASYLLGDTVDSTDTSHLSLLIN